MVAGDGVLCVDMNAFARAVALCCFLDFLISFLSDEDVGGIDVGHLCAG